MRVRSTQVVVTHRVSGFHYWPGAPDETSYLRHRHRHLFMLVVGFEVLGHNREVEFHAAQATIRGMYEDPHDFGSKSCEMIAKELGEWLGRVDMPPAFVEVWEDEENGARVEFSP